MFEMLTSHNIRLLWFHENIHAVNGTYRSEQRNLSLGDSWVFASLYPTIIYSIRFQIFSVPPFKSNFLQITCLFLQLQSIATTSCNESSQYYFHTPQIAALEAILRSEELCRTMDPWKCWHRRAFLCCMFTLCNITVCFTNIYPVILSSLKDK